jgi:capsular exopolysaccharide synthesis family protein
VVENEAHLWDYLKVLRKRRFTVGTFFVVVFAVVVIATFTTTPLYMSTTRLYVEKVEPYSLIKEIRYSTYDPEFFGTQYQIIKSKRVAGKIVDMLSPDRTFRAYFKGGHGFGVAGMSPLGWFSELYAVSIKLLGLKKGETPPEAGEEDGSLRDDIVKSILDGIMVKPVKDTKIINISYMSENPELSSLVANTAAKAYIEATFEMKMNASKNTLQWMTKKTQEEGSKLEESERALQSYMQDRDIVTLQDRLTIIPEKLSELSTNLTRAEAKRKEIGTLYDKIKALPRNLRGAESLPVISSDSILRSIREQVIGAEKNVMELSKKYGKKHPLMIKARGDLDMLNRKRKQETKRVMESIKNEYELALSNEKNLGSLLSETKQEALDLNEKFIQYSVLKREVETNSQLYDSLITKMKEQSITEEIHSVNVWIVEEAEPPEEPVKPKKLLNMLLGIVMGLFGGVGLAFFIEYLDNTVKSPEEAEARLGVPVLGTVSLKKEEKGSDEGGIEMVVVNEPKSTYAESYKALRTAIMLSSADAPPKCILVTSSGPGEGKTTTSVNLALAVAQAGRRVLLMDADLRKPAVHKVFGKSNGIGLSTYLAGDASPIIQKGPLPGIDIITSGPIPPNPSELLSAERFNALLSRLKEKYDVVVCDSPPVLTVTDSLVLSRRFDGTILVVRAGKTSYDFVRNGLKTLEGRRTEDIRPHVFGLLINALDLRKSDYYYYYRYYNYYYSEEEEKDKKPV